MAIAAHDYYFWSLYCANPPSRPGPVLHACSPSTVEEAPEDRELETSFRYVARSNLVGPGSQEMGQGQVQSKSKTAPPLP